MVLCPGLNEILHVESLVLSKHFINNVCLVISIAHGFLDVLGGWASVTRGTEDHSVSRAHRVDVP